jgi:hypothetical protein
MTVHVTKVLEEAIVEVAALPSADQEKIGREIIAYVEKLRALRADLDLGIQSLDRGEGREVTLEEILRLARERHAAR